MREPHPPLMMTPVVLILESAPELRGMLEDGLRQDGYAVRVASDPDEAVSLMRRMKVDLVLADAPNADGPGRDGMLQEIHEAFPDVPSIVVAPDAFDPESLLASAAGDYRRQRLGRPFTLYGLLAAVRRATGGPAPGSHHRH